MLSKRLLPFIFLLLALATVSAQAAPGTFSVEVIPLETKIAINETASFNITIFNGFEDDREFYLEKIGYPFWDMYLLPLANPITIVVPEKSQKSFVLYVRPLHITVVDTYTLDTYVADMATEIKQLIPLTVGIRSTEGLIQGYVPTVLTSVQMPSIIDPRKPLRVTVNLNNQNLLDYPNLTIRLSSALVNGEFLYELGPKEEKKVEIVKQLNPTTPPQQDRLVISVLREGKSIINPITKEFSIEEYVIKDEQPESSNFLKSQKRISFTSNNPQYQGILREETSSFSSLFTSTRPKAAIVSEGDKDYFVWSISFNDERKMEISITRNYRPLVIIIAIIVILIALYFVFRSPIVIMKEVASVSTKEGGISEVKIILRLKNRGKETLTGIEVGDIVPQIASVEKEMSIGVMHPDKITTHHNQGTIIKWTIQQLEPSEGVVLSYKMKSRLTIVGDFHLPSATARCKHRNSYVITNSNRVMVNG